MTRIITPELNKKLKTEYTFRFFSVLFISISTVFIIHVAFAASSYMLLSSYEKLYQSKLSNTDILKQNEEFILKVNTLDMLSKQIEFHPGTNYSALVFDKIQQYAGNKIIINAFELYKEESKGKEKGIIEEKIKITIRGLATTREDLVTFESQIKSDNSFSDFLIPIDAFTKQKDINFDVTFTYNEKQ